MRVKLSVFFIGVFFNYQVDSQTNFQRTLENLMRNEKMKGAAYGISVIESGKGKIIFEENANQSLVPASVLKTVTSATAIEVLGGDFVFKTILGYTGEIDPLSSTLKGDLVVVAGGDPTLGSGYFRTFYRDSDFLDQWIEKIRGTGIKRIAGNLVIDATLYGDNDIPGTWAWDDIGNYYGAGAGAITIYDNLFRIIFKSGVTGELTQILRTEPEVNTVEISNQVRASKVNRDNAYVYGSPWDGKRVIKGTIPANRDEFVIKASLPDPAKFLGERLRTRLIDQNIMLIGEVLVQKTDSAGGFHPIFIQESPSLKEIVTVLNHESVNLFAEQLLKHIAHIETGSGTVENGTEFILKYWKARGLDTSGMFIEDGSGLSHFNAISPSQLTWILNYMKNSRLSVVFSESLPTAGKGTLTVFNPSDFPQNCLRAKSGSITRVRNYTGYMRTVSGRELVFAILFNNFSLSQSEMTREIGKLLLEMRNIQ